MLCKIFTCFLLLTTGLMKKKEEKHVYFFLKGSHSIIHHFIGFQPDYPKRNVISSPPTTHRRLVLNYGVRHCLAVCVRNCTQRDAQDPLSRMVPVPSLALSSSPPSLYGCRAEQVSKHSKFSFTNSTLYKMGNFFCSLETMILNRGNFAPVSLYLRVALFEDTFDCYS